MVNFKKPLGLRFFDMVYELEVLFKEKKVQVVSRGGIKDTKTVEIKSQNSFVELGGILFRMNYLINWNFSNK